VAPALCAPAKKTIPGYKDGIGRHEHGGRRGPAESHNETRQHDDGDHRVDHEREELLTGVVDALRRQRILRAAEEPEKAHDEPAPVVPVERDLLPEHLAAEVGAEADDPVDEEDRDACDAERDVESQEVRAPAEDAFRQPGFDS
jgi:hypothetical protein